MDRMQKKRIFGRKPGMKCWKMGSGLDFEEGGDCEIYISINRK